MKFCARKLGKQQLKEQLLKAVRLIMHTDRTTRHKRIRARIVGTKTTPRLSVFRSNKFVFAQVIDDVARVTLVSAHEKLLRSSAKKSDRAFELGKTIAQLCADKGIKSVVFDRGGYRYHGRVERLAQGAREGGLKF